MDILNMIETERKLATIQRIHEIVSIPNADAIEIAKVMGWQAIIKKGEFNVGDKCVFFEVDSFLPMQPCYEFLEKSSYRNNEFMGMGYKIHTMRLRGSLSQGLIMPLSTYPHLALETLEVGADVTCQLGVRKWEIPETEGPAGTQKGNKPFGIPTTNELRVQSSESLRTALLGLPYYITTKIDGTSMTVYHKNGVVGVCGHHYEYKDDGSSGMWEYVKKTGLVQALLNYGRNISIQGEYAGPGIQKNKLKLSTYTFNVFDVFCLDTYTYFDFDALVALCKELNLTMVPIEEEGESFNYTQDELLEKASGLYPSGTMKEGIVVRPKTTMQRKIAGGRLSFKVINNSFLLKEK